MPTILDGELDVGPDLHAPPPGPPRIAVLLLTDGRGAYLEQTIDALERNVTGPIAHRVIHDDSGDPRYTAWLQDRYTTEAATWGDTYRVVTAGLVGAKSGFDGAIRSAWRHLEAIGDFTHVLHLEEDFTFEKCTDVAAVAAVLDANPHLAQMAFRRQPWPAYRGEEPGVGYVDKYLDHHLEVTDGEGHNWLEQARLFTTNPSLYPRRVLRAGWPEGANSEDRALERIRNTAPIWGVRGDTVRSAWWGGLEDGRDWVRHIGEVRTGHSY